MFKVDSVAELYSVIGKELLEAKVISPRGIETKEIVAPQIVITNPRARLAYNKNRRYNLIFALVESLMLYSDSNELSYFEEFNSNMANFSDDGKTLNGAYGKRISPYLDALISRLKGDNNTRQAVLTIYSSNDIALKTKDVPCTATLQFLIRDGKLTLITTMRSNDMIYGVPYDIFMFTMLQEAVANTLEIDVGYYIHQPASLHVYKEYFNFNGYEMLENLANETESVPFSNTSDVGQWTILANVHTGKELFIEPNIGSTAFDAFNLISIERMYREGMKTDTEREAFRGYLGHIPDWSVLFSRRWFSA